MRKWLLPRISVLYLSLNSPSNTLPISTATRRLTTLRSMSSSCSSGDTFFQRELFAVVGASNDRDKFGNKVLRCYKQHGYKVIPINKRTPEIEGVTCVPTLSDLLTQSEVKAPDVGVSIVTPPGVTRLILEEGYKLGIRHFFLQPGTIDRDGADYIRDFMPDANVIKSCVLVDLGFKGEPGEAW